MRSPVQVAIQGVGRGLNRQEGADLEGKNDTDNWSNQELFNRLKYEQDLAIQGCFATYCIRPIKRTRPN